MVEPAPESGIAAIARAVSHADPSEVAFQLSEIVGRRTYLQHGVEVSEGDVVLDVGANVGVAAAFFALGCRAELVHSFEPVAPVFEVLERNLRDIPGCVAHPCGLSSAEGRAAITYYPAAAAMSGLYADPERDREQVRRCMLNIGMSEETIESELTGRYEGVELGCELRTLSGVLREESLERVDLLKIDVERAELDVLAGIEEADWPRIGQLVAEVHEGGDRVATIAAMLRERGFTVTVDQDDVMRGTPIHMVYARRR